MSPIAAQPAPVSLNMATAQHVKSLIQSHFQSEHERFKTLALQLAAHEAKRGHVIFAEEIRKIIDQARLTVKTPKSLTQDLHGLVLETEAKERLSDLIVSDSLKERLQRVLKEYRKKELLKKHGLENRRKVLLTGPPGTGKTMTAAIIAKESHLPLYIILMDKMVTKFMGETSAKLRQVFDVINEKRGVYLFDEFDAIGTERSKDNDVGEMRRVLNSFLQFIERDQSESIIIAATNNVKLLDQALFRRFDDVLQYHLPTEAEATSLLENRLAGFKGSFKTSSLIPYTKFLSHAEISQACMDAIKETILEGKTKVDKPLMMKMLKDRVSVYEPNQ